MLTLKYFRFIYLNSVTFGNDSRLINQTTNKL